MELPTCPLCKTERLIPLSEDSRTYAIWVCVGPDCSYSISNSVHTTYYKGNAGRAVKKTNAKEYVEYDF